MDHCINKWMDGWIAEWLDGWMDGWMANWLMNGWMDDLSFLSQSNINMERYTVSVDIHCKYKTIDERE